MRKLFFTGHSWRRLLCLFVLVVVIVSLFTPSQAKPARAACTWGDIICDMQSALQQLLDNYVTPLQAWVQLQANKALYTLEYNLAHTLAAFLWGVSKMLTTVGVGIGILNEWLAQNFFQPMIQMTSDTMKPIVGIFLFVALGILGISYFLAAIIRLNVVSLRSVVVWWLAGALFFSVGPAFYLSMRNLHQAINSLFYSSALNALNGRNPFQNLAAGDPAATNPLYQMPTLCSNFSRYLLGSAGNLNALDVSLAFQRADGFDVVNGGDKCLGGGTTLDLPRRWLAANGFFDAAQAPDGWPGIVTCPPAPAVCDYDTLVQTEVTQMQVAVNQTFAGIAREWQSIPLVWVAIIEQLVALCLLVAQGLTFISFACAILFAFFRRTEPIAWAIVDQWLSLLIQSVVIALVQGMTLALYLAAASSGSPLVSMAVSVVALVMLIIILVSGLKAVWSAFNRLFEAFGQASGGVFLSPGQAGSAVAGAAISMGGAAVTGGLSLASGALSLTGSAAGGAQALSSGATWAQAAGVTFGGSKALDGAAYHLARLPGLNDTALGEAANQYIEGASTRRVGDTLLGATPGVGGALSRLGGASLGAALLTDRNPEHAEANSDERGQVYWKQPMLRPKTDESMASFLSGPTWNAGQFSSLGRGGIPLSDTDETPLRRGDIGTELARTPQSSAWAESSKPLTLNNDGDLDETLDQDFKRDLRADRQERQTGSGSDAERLTQAAQKLDDTSGALKASADALRQSAQSSTQNATQTARQNNVEPVEGRLNVSGANNLAAILSRTIDALQQQNQASGQQGATSDRVSRAMASAMGVTPLEEKGHTIAPIEGRTNRYQMFADQALRYGVSGADAAQVLREVKASPDGYLQSTTRERLIRSQREERGEAWNEAVQNVQSIEHAARLVPSTVTAYGMRTVPVSMGGQPIVLSGGENGSGAVVFTPTPTSTRRATPERSMSTQNNPDNPTAAQPKPENAPQSSPALAGSEDAQPSSSKDDAPVQPRQPDSKPTDTPKTDKAS